MTTLQDSRGHMPDGPWAFDAKVTAVFEDMLRRSIPQYTLMRDTVTALAARYRRPGASIVDLGCSRGDALADLVAVYRGGNRYFGVDVSEPMLEQARARFNVPEFRGLVDIQAMDLRTGYPDVGAACVTMSVLTLQFVPINYRQEILRQVYEHTLPGGALIVVEKVLGQGAQIDAAMVQEYHRLKLQNGYTPDEVDRKRLALEGVLVPVTAAWNEQLLRTAGFREVDCFWRWMNFAGWLALKT